jgi:ketopantoate reductase
MPSFHVDLHAGRDQTEAPYLHGAVARIGQRVGIETPVNWALSNTVERMAKGETPLDMYARNPEKFIREMKLEAA